MTVHLAGTQEDDKYAHLTFGVCACGWRSGSACEELAEKWVTEHLEGVSA